MGHHKERDPNTVKAIAALVVFNTRDAAASTVRDKLAKLTKAIDVFKGAYGHPPTVLEAIPTYTYLEADFKQSFPELTPQFVEYLDDGGNSPAIILRSQRDLAVASD